MINPAPATDRTDLGSVETVFSGLAGTWTLSRRIGADWRFRGRAVFRPHGENELRYEEHGLLSQGGGTEYPASRRYVYRYEDGGIVVYFDEQPLRLFQRLAPARAADGSWRAQAGHDCEPDHYASRYRFGADAITISHRVRGPRKNFEIVSDYVFASRDPIALA